jgi:hypothetical protein
MLNQAAKDDPRNALTQPQPHHCPLPVEVREALVTSPEKAVQRLCQATGKQSSQIND